MVECSRCGGEVREGLAFITMSVPSGGSMMGGMFPSQGMNMPQMESSREAQLKWREKTGKEVGWILKSKEEKILNIKGRRCLECGYIEFYIDE